MQFQITESFSFFQIEEVDLVERRGYLTLRILVKNEPGRLLLRKTDGIRKWYQLIQVNIGHNIGPRSSGCHIHHLIWM